MTGPMSEQTPDPAPDQEDDVSTTPAPANTELRSEITHALNRASAENGSDTPDHVLADYLLGCLAVFDAAVLARSTWYGHHQQIEYVPDSRDQRVRSEFAADVERRINLNMAFVQSVDGLEVAMRCVQAALVEQASS